MKKTGAVAALLTGSLALLGASALSAQSSTRPPTVLKKVGDHWTPWDPPEAGPGAYIIQKDDTLWDLAGRWLGDPFLWPQVWDENRYILDSHWIYPGDPLVVPGTPTVVPEEGPPAVSEVSPQEGEAEEKPPVLPKPPPLVPAADPSDLYCSGYIEHHEPPPLSIVGRDVEREILGEGDVVFLSHGRDQGIRAGDEFSVQRPTIEVKHPVTGRSLGTLVRRLGKVRVLVAHETKATAVITLSCEDIREKDELVPWVEIPVPMLASIPPLDRYDPTPSGGPTGRVVAVKDDLSAFATGNVIHTDLGLVSGVNPGDLLTLYRDRADDLPRQLLGQAVVLTVEPDTSTAKVVTSLRESWVGDGVEVVR